MIGSLTSNLVVTVILSMLTITTFLVNLITLLALTYRRRSTLTPTSRSFAMTLTISLVIADTSLSLVTMPMSVYYYANESWGLGKVMCR